MKKIVFIITYPIDTYVKSKSKTYQGILSKDLLLNTQFVTLEIKFRVFSTNVS